MRATDAYAADLQTFTHEAAHAVAAVHYGARLIRVVGHRHHALTADERGSVEWIAPEALTPEQEAVILLSGRAAAEGLDVLVDAYTSDERAAARLGLSRWVEARRIDAWVLCQRRDVGAAIERLSGVLLDAPVLAGAEAERVIAGA